MTRRWWILIGVAALCLPGCVSKKEMEKAQAELAACREETAEAEARVIAWQERFDRENEFWQELQSEVGEAVPRALEEIHQERERIIAAVPDQVRGELEIYLDDYFATVMQGFETLQRDNDDIQLQLEATRNALEVVGSGTREINDRIEGALTEERSRRDRLAKHLSDVVGQIVEFDQTRVNCRGCRERLRLNRKERETIMGFHAELMSDLADLERLARRPRSEDEEVEDGEGAEDAGPDDASAIGEATETAS